MTSLLKKIFVQSEKTFATINKESIKANVLALKKLIDMMELTDINVDPYHFTNRAFQKRNKAPCSFISICEKEHFTMSVFVIDSGYTMPLHDHPGMFGILKVISGQLKIQSYTRIPTSIPHEILVHAEEPKIINADSDSTYLDDKLYNYHEITAVDGPAAFFDVLAPPYSDIDDKGSDARHCQFYRKLVAENIGKTILELERIECPNHYYCDSIHFERPDFMV